MSESASLAALKPIMSDQEVIRRFEHGEVSPDSFHHADHVRLAFAYLQEHPPLTALDKFSAALKRFAASIGKPDRYHETITCAYIFLIRERMSRRSAASWDDFAAHNPDLLLWKDGILDRYYQPATLQSELARRIFVFPDKVFDGR
jgi:hypothetical protein